MSNGVASANAAAAAAVIGAFRAAGGRRAIVSPGSRSTPLVQALAGTDLDVRVVLDERTAAFIAVGAARSGGRPVLLVCTSGSAGAHYGPAVAEAIEAGLPLWLVTADRPPELHGIGAPQTTCQHDWYGGNIARLVVAAADEVDPGELAGRVTAAAPEAGPLHLNIGFREPLVADRVPRIDVAPVLRPAATQPCPLPLAEDLDGAARPLIVLGPDAERLWTPGGWGAWAQETDVPIVADVQAGTAAGLRGLDAMLRDETLREALRPDVVMQFGRLPTSKALGQWLARCEAEGVPVWHVSPDQRPHAWRPSDRVVTGPIAAPDVAPQSTPGWTATWHALAAAVSGITPDPGFWEAHIWRTLAQALPDGATVLAGSSMAVRDADQWFMPRQRVRVVSNRGVNGIDGGIATACGIGWECGDAPVLAVLGDLAFLHDAGSLLELRRHDNVRVLVVDNGGGGIFSYLPIAAREDLFEPWFLTPQHADAAAIAFGYGLEVATVASVADLSAAFADSSRVIVARVDRDRSVAAHRAFWCDAAKAARAVLGEGMR